jgi:phosphoribosylformylglycinamidine cyclo-ligase
MKTKYGKLGVDVEKKGIEAFKDATSGLYKHAFCDIHPDPDMSGYGFVHHSDGAGSKPVQNYLNWKETGDINSFRGVAQDTLAMNIGDALCVGIPTSGSFVDYVAINGLYVPKKEVLQILAEDWKNLFTMLENYGINIKFAGGETADLPDQLKTFDVSGAIHARYKLDNMITGEVIVPGDVIIGLASGGKAIYEDKPSGPIMCNGLTLARHCLMRPELSIKYPEICEPGKEYTGPFFPTYDGALEGIEGTIGEEITRPTRIFAPIFKAIIENFGDAVHGIVFNTGGGHTKCLRVGKEIRYIKDNLPEPPVIFKLVQEHGKVPWREMYEDFNMGVGAEMYVDSNVVSELPSFLEEGFGIEAWRIGECRRATGPNKVRLETPHGNFNYRKK